MGSTIKEMFDLSDQVAVITGGARHFGYDMADVLAEAGCDVVITSRQPAHAEAAAEKLRARHKRDVLPLGVDVTDPAQVKALAEKAESFKGHVEILVNNAGGSPGPGASLFGRKPEEIQQLISVNLLGMIYCCQEFGRIMVKRKRGKIINIASIAALLGRDRRMYERLGMRGQPVDYAAAKSGIVGLTMDVAAVLSPHGVHVNCISPGGFDRAGTPREFVQAYSDRTPMGRMGRQGSADLKGPALFLASAASDYVTGHNLVADGGFTAWQ